MKYPERCENCGRRSIYIRVRKQEVFCHKCGKITPLEGVVRSVEDDVAERTRKRILDMIVSSEKAAPPPNFGYGSVMYRQVRAACRYAGPIDAELGRLHEEGVVENWTPGTGVVYIDFRELARVRPDVLKPGQAEELAKPYELPEPPRMLERSAPEDDMPGDF